MNELLVSIGWSAANYLKLNADLRESLGATSNSEAALVAHYVQHGIFEGRAYRKDENPLQLVIDDFQYVNGVAVLFGWSSDPFASFDLVLRSGSTLITSTAEAMRFWRNDVSTHLGVPPRNFPHGFVALCAVQLPQMEYDVAVIANGKARPVLNIKLNRRDGVEHFLHSILFTLNANLDYNESCYCFSEYPRFLSAIHSLNRHLIEQAKKCCLLDSSKSKQSKPKLSVVCVTLGGAHILKAFLMTQLCNFDSSTTELLIFVNSLKEVDAILNSCKFVAYAHGFDIRVFGSSENIGFNGAVNFLVKKAYGQKILITNIDIEFTNIDLAGLEKIAGSSAIVAALQFNPAGLLQHKALDVGVESRCCNGQEYEVVSTRLIGRNTFEELSTMAPKQKVKFWGAACMYADAKVFRKLGPFSANYLFAYHEDTDLAVRAHEAGVDVFVSSMLAVVHYESSAAIINFPKAVAIAANAVTVTKRLSESDIFKVSSHK